MDQIIESYQPPSCDDESVFALVRKERLCRFLFAVEGLRFSSSVSLTNPQLLTADPETGHLFTQNIAHLLLHLKQMED